jgi:DNA polymerase I-like protein with 3'-5' exonuclease and polymerase domains
MIYQVLDVETTFKKMGKKSDPSPYNPENFLVSVGLLTIPFSRLDGLSQINLHDYIDYYVCRSNSKLEGNSCTFSDQRLQYKHGDVKTEIQQKITDADVIIGHNVKFDISWMRESSLLPIDRRLFLYDTQLVEYILSRGNKRALDLDSCAQRYKIAGKDTIIYDEYVSKGISFEDIPLDKVVPYGRQDLITTLGVAIKQCEILGATIHDLAA